MLLVVVGMHVAISSSDVNLRHLSLLDLNEHLTSQSKRKKKIEVTLVSDVHSKFYKNKILGG